MKSMENDIKECLRANLTSGLDAWLLEAGFTRRGNGLIYARELAESIQKIEVAVETHPKDRPDSAAAVYPWLEVSMAAVDQLALEMVGGDLSLLKGLPDITLREPIELTSAKAAHARWFIFQPDSVPGVVSEMRLFLQQWTIPFLNSYSTPAEMCLVYAHDDARVITQPIRVAAAMVLCGRTADAFGVMDRWFGKPGPRKQYQRVFDYLTAER
ncbi:MAG TPA: hypothetical protein PKE29_17710 [Phycisphaerales bacterium]|nr:hypothetical protein [Phycisphaerales bacterium]